MIEMKPQLVPALITCQAFFINLGKELVITSISDGKHKEGSKHYTGEAFDIRTFHLAPYELQDCLKYLRSRLDNQYDIVLEVDHIHIEYDEKL